MNQKEYNKNYRKRNREYCLAYGRKHQRELKLAALVHYGGNPPKCDCCGETVFDFLTIDHINGKGNRHRKEKGVGNNIYYWFKRENYPLGFRVLCMNCNWGIGIWGCCPHKRQANG